MTVCLCVRLCNSVGNAVDSVGVDDCCIALLRIGETVTYVKEDGRSLEQPRSIPLRMLVG